ncbi:MAG: tetratricopeptide repeat protein [Candidatus Melainabacteria bacterium]|nr:tetratricopeptide repeat protein [Candidatus Melainabacteria bacterium]
MSRKKISLNIFLLFILLILCFIHTPAYSQGIQEAKESAKNFNPKPASASLYNLGLKSYEQGDLQSAVIYFKKAIDLDPEFVDAYYNLGAIYKKQKNLPLAIFFFQKAVELNSKDAEATYELASCYYENKNFIKAKEYFSLLPKDFPKYGEVMNKLGIINQTLVQQNNSSTAESQAQLLVNTLTKPSQEDFKDPVKTVTSNLNGGPTGIAKDSKNNLYVANFTKDRIERINANGTREIFIEKLGIKGPVGIAIDQSDNIYVANYTGNSILKITQNKEVTVLADNIIKPYYLFYDTESNKLFATLQGNDSLVELEPTKISKQPITSR